MDLGYHDTRLIGALVPRRPSTAEMLGGEAQAIVASCPRSLDAYEGSGL